MNCRSFPILVIFLFVSIFARSQYIAGIGFAYGSEIERLGLQIRGEYEFQENMSAAFKFNHFFKANIVDAQSRTYAINIDGHYLWEAGDDVTLYPLVGLNYVRTRVEFVNETNKDGDLGINIGAGVRYWLEDLLLIGEVKYIFGRSDQVVISVGLAYYFY
jgi:hypothetical protein